MDTPVDRELDASDLNWGWPDEPKDREPSAPTQPPEVFPASWRLLDDVAINELPDPQWIIEHVLQERTIVIVYGPPAAGKTTFLAGLFTCIATGARWFGHNVAMRGSGVSVVAEDSPGFKSRLRAAKRAARLPLDSPIGVYAFPEPIDLRDVDGVQRFCRFLKATEWPQPLVAVAIDTYAASTPGSSENSSEDTTAAMTQAQFIRDALGVAVILVHHTNAAGSRERGHSAMRGAADTMIALSPADDVITVECSKQRNAQPFDSFFLKLVPASDGAGCVLRLASEVLETDELTQAQRKVLDVLRDTFGTDGATKSEWQRSCHDVAERTFHRACKALVEIHHHEAARARGAGAVGGCRPDRARLDRDGTIPRGRRGARLS